MSTHNDYQYLDIVLDMKSAYILFYYIPTANHYIFNKHNRWLGTDIRLK